MALSQYMLAPASSHAPVPVAVSAATRKTILQIATPSTQDITIFHAAITFDGVTAANVPAIVDLIETNVAATVTSMTPVPYGDPNAPASLCVGGAAATGYNASAEGTITASRLIHSWYVPPTSGAMIQLPLGRNPGVAVSKFLRLRVLAPNAVNALGELGWEE